MSVSLDLHGGDWCYRNGERVAGKPQNIKFRAIVIADLLIVTVFIIITICSSSEYVRWANKALFL